MGSLDIRIYLLSNDPFLFNNFIHYSSALQQLILPDMGEKSKYAETVEHAVLRERSTGIFIR
ncbi:MAG: hypothetical protein J0I32_06365 [Sphingobacteriales bacterium]|nr:hypothetical protein [Sphingobacteriales bacterium]OJW03819.1 MAG: hypothetical protein BGO52_16795 [Sphingobacteriales bacterium 44-61]